jgi:hypothetical protein
MIGTTLSHFKITAKLGEGAMGEVYRAEDSQLGREVAVKVLPSDMAADPGRLERFRREAKSVAALNHPNIVTIHSVEEADGVHLLTMELVEGKSLDQVLPPGGFALETLFPVAIQIADALAAAHDRGITHRDLKPANIMVSDEGRVKILDFGLAKLAESEGDEEATQLMTQAGLHVARAGPGQPVDPRSDIFSLGILLYEMATGQRPFQGDNPASVISAVLREQPPPVTDLKADLPNHLGRIVRRCLEKHPQRRFQSARDVQRELEGLEAEPVAVGGGVADSVSAGAGDVGRLPRAPSRSWLPWLVAGAAVVAAAILAAIALRPAPELPVVVSNLLPPEGFSFNAVDGPPVLSPDGRHLAFLAAAPDEPTHLFVRSLGFFADGKLKRTEVAGGRPQVLADAPLPAGGTWAGNGTIVFVGDAAFPPSLVDDDGGPARRLPAPTTAGFPGTSGRTSCPTTATFSSPCRIWPGPTPGSSSARSIPPTASGS